MSLINQRVLSQIRKFLVKPEIQGRTSWLTRKFKISQTRCQNRNETRKRENVPEGNRRWISVLINSWFRQESKFKYNLTCSEWIYAKNPQGNKKDILSQKGLSIKYGEGVQGSVIMIEKFIWFYLTKSIVTSGRRSSLLAFRWSTGNGASGHYFQHYFLSLPPLFSPCGGYFSQRRSTRLKRKSLWLDIFQDSVMNFIFKIVQSSSNT